MTTKSPPPFSGSEQIPGLRCWNQTWETGYTGENLVENIPRPTASPERAPTLDLAGPGIQKNLQLLLKKRMQTQLMVKQQEDASNQ